MESVSAPLAISLKHELTHSFLFQKTQGAAKLAARRIAQWMTGRRSGQNAAQLIAMFQGSQGKSLRSSRILDEILQFGSGFPTPGRSRS